MTNEKQVKVAKLVTIAVVAILFLLVSTLIFQFVKINHLKNSQQDLQNQLTQLEQNIIYYSSENGYLESSEFVEDYAREVLGYGLNGETRFR